VGEVAVSSATLGDNVMVSLDWAKLIGPLPAPPPFCSAAVTADGTVYVSGSQAVALSPSGKPALVPGGPGPEVRHILTTTIDAAASWVIKAQMYVCSQCAETIGR
jgi:hypothetical protein